MLYIVSNSNSSVTGTIAIGGKQIDPFQYRQKIAYVMQEDCHMKTVTPREALEFSAKLRLPPSTSAEFIKSTVHRTIVELGLEKCADSMCGGGLVQGISGGEKKRTSIGVEIITNPDVSVTATCIATCASFMHQYLCLTFIDSLFG